MARDFDRQVAKFQVKFAVLNGITALGIPVTKVVGQVCPAEAAARPSVDLCSRAIEINHLFVVEWRRKAGIGRALIAALREMSLAAGAEYLVIGTHRENLGAQGAYRQMGLAEPPMPGPWFKVELA